MITVRLSIDARYLARYFDPRTMDRRLTRVMCWRTCFPILGASTWCLCNARVRVYLERERARLGMDIERFS